MEAQQNSPVSIIILHWTNSWSVSGKLWLKGQFQGWSQEHLGTYKSNLTRLPSPCVTLSKSSWEVAKHPQESGLCDPNSSPHSLPLSKFTFTQCKRQSETNSISQLHQFLLKQKFRISFPQTTTSCCNFKFMAVPYPVLLFIILLSPKSHPPAEQK